ncbi:hypothetical protein GCK72_013668 [Caenorhabditis remanei]|uniref:Uncharacterized protein n=1 Tax=Caenorhabditis remanei TaxID=31234 RepID=A0A6A5GRL0_CAERE|nr:hypothetical protein GCK72_013668 [Caenorhabditis remanei]KAF1757213.1 hypothetical protein GCK72_013668 [Caenorhabditis remanei]
MNRISVFIVLLFISLASAGLSACGTSGCPTGGIWSDWTVTGNTNCSTSCGSCSSLYYTRICISELAGCNCTGDTSRYIPCNTDVCAYPSQKSCCTPYVPMVIDGSYICGPIPVDKSSSTTSCCPTGGLLSDWSLYGRNDENTAWIRTRECLTTDVGCACTDNLIETSTACPCPTTLVDLTDTSCNTVNYAEAYYSNIVVNDTKCEATFSMQASNYTNSGNSEKYIYCGHDGNYTSSGTPIILFQISPNETKATTCQFDRPFDCGAISTESTAHPTVPISFTCDLEALTWQYDYNGWHVTGYNQAMILYD